MRILPTRFAAHAARVVALVVIVALFSAARLPQLSALARDKLAASFHFVEEPLPILDGAAVHTIRTVHPQLQHIASWISSVGAAVALTDLDGDGLANDLCYVRTGTNEVILAPAPGTGARYAPFTLEPASLSYDAQTMAPMGCLPGDMNEDGHIDLLVYYWGRTPIGFLRHTGNAPDNSGVTHSSYVARELIPPQTGGSAADASGRWFTNAATFADLDGDGHVDLVIGNYFQDGARILDATATESTYMQHSMSRAFNAGRNRLLLWQGATTGAQPTVHFAEAEGDLDEETTYGWTLAVGAADLDGDLLPELYFANDFGPDRLLHNRSQPGRLHFVQLTGQRGLTTPRSKVVGRDSFKGMGVDFGDLNGDGRFDIYVSNIAAEYALEESHFVYLSTGDTAQMAAGVAPYVDQSEALGLSRSGWGWESRLGDFNNDGVLEAVQATGFVHGETDRWPDLHELAMGNDELLRHPAVWPRFQPGADLSGSQHNPFFVRAADGRYYDLAPELKLDRPQVTRGIATADVDGDGDLDFAVANQWESSWFYRNDCSACGAYLGLHLLRPVRQDAATETAIYKGHPTTTVTGAPAIGATATVYLPDGERLIAQVDGGNGHSGVRSPDLHFGLGDLPPDSTLTVALHWRDGAGHVHEETISIAPGWHTILLGQDG